MQLPLHPISDCYGYHRGTPVDRIYIEAFLNQPLTSTATTSVVMAPKVFAIPNLPETAPVAHRSFPSLVDPELGDVLGLADTVRGTID